MTEEMSIEEYLARGGVITAPDNAHPRYRAELLRIMASFADSELAGAAGFAEQINAGPGIKERITAARIVLEKLDHAERVLNIMEEFGANTARYMDLHPWAARVGRDDDLGAERRAGDMRLNVFHYPLDGWADSVMMNVLMGHATLVQLSELAQCSYQPLAEAFQDILIRERRHTELGVEGLRRLKSNDPSCDSALLPSADYWRPRVDASFGASQSSRYALLKKFGLRHRDNDHMREEWRKNIDKTLGEIIQ